MPGRGLLEARLGRGLIGLEGMNEVMISEDSSESASESSSRVLSEDSDDEEEVDISESSFSRFTG
ncbi:hypothetical protein CVT25_007308 [Psilocybe cyanescens]|uniref:Uncharacterized protein n=1 Tax=Psilocybe cyanescens TaxID=93625 RepID=A0A409XPJ3_PSICY|nr:hypothetical protein CVT25_007308 [Psilocybe cyanescens]